MNIKFVKYLTLFLAATLIACQHSNSKLEVALRLSGDNRHELEKVLAHYSRHNKDSLHLKAAIFLIENMPGHYTLDSPFLENYRANMDSIHPEMSNVVKSVVYTIPIRQQVQVGHYEETSDLTTITSDYLIEHIDNRMAMWQTCEWLQDVSFENFCEYLLPYRMTYEPLLAPDSTQTLWKEIKDKMYYFHFIPIILDDVKSFQRNIIGNSDDAYLLNMEMAGIPWKQYTFDCMDMCLYDVMGFRYAGIPSTIDFVPHWATRNGSHYWRTIIDPSCVHESYNDVHNPRTAKVYRMTYSHNPIPKPNQRDSIPAFFQDPFNRDVTDQYVRTTDLTISTRDIREYIPEYIYLAVFNNLDWQPIAWASNNGKEAVFENMGTNVVYLPIYYCGQQRKSFGYPIKVGTHSIQCLKPDTVRCVDITLSRKYPLTYSKIHWTLSLIGGYLEASNNPDFIKCDTLGQITAASPSLNWMKLHPQSQTSYRYWRLRKQGRPIALAELEFYDSQGDKLSGKALANNGQANPKAFDGDVLTYANYHSWIGLDFGKPVTVQEVRYMSRTDDNGICVGNEYELFYYDDGKWVSAGYQVAKHDLLTFKEIPSNALYWLKNLNGGKEERIFTVHNGHIEFW